MRCLSARSEDLTCWRGGDDEPAVAASGKAAPAPVMEVTAVIRRLRAQPLSPRAQPTYAASAEAPSSVGRTASAPVAGAHRAHPSPGLSLDPSPGWALGAPPGAARTAGARAGGNGSGGSDAPGAAPAACGAAPPHASPALANPFAAALPAEPACPPEAAHGARAAGDGCSAGGCVGVGLGSCAEPREPSGGDRGAPAAAAAAAGPAHGVARGEISSASAAVESGWQPCSEACSGCLNCVGMKVPSQSRCTPFCSVTAVLGRTSVLCRNRPGGLAP